MVYVAFSEFPHEQIHFSADHIHAPLPALAIPLDFSNCLLKDKVLVLTEYPS